MKRRSPPSPAATGSAQDLNHSPAVEKIRQLAKSARVCFFGTTHGSPPLDVRPMTVQEVDVVGNLWFLSARSSALNKDIARNPKVQLLFANPADSEFLNLQGFATIHDTKAFREKYYTPLAKTWFPGGVNDPELTVIRVMPREGHYWDTVYGKAVTLLMVAVGAVTGQPMDIGVQGDIKP